MPSYFPSSEIENVAICLTGMGANKPFSCIITSIIPNLHTIDTGQVFPLRYFEEEKYIDMFEDRYNRRSGISEFCKNYCIKQYNNSVSEKDIFYYVYGILHSTDYKKTFEADLKKSLPRIPFVDSYDDFKVFSEAGRKLADLHLNYENVELYKCGIVDSAGLDVSEEDKYIVQKMRFGKKDGTDNQGKKKKVEDKSVIVYNDWLTIKDIPERAYDYVVNGKSAIEWIMERYAVTVDKASGIKNDPNDWSKEVGDPMYIFNLVRRIITVSMETLDIVDSLPKLNFE